MFCGVSAFSFTAERVSQFVCASVLEKSDLITRLGNDRSLSFRSLGIIARKVDDLARLAKTIVEFYKVDRSLPPVPWRTD